MKSIITSTLLCFAFFCAAQNSNIDLIANEYIIQLKTDVDGFSFFQKIKKGNSLLEDVILENRISKKLNLYKLTTNNSSKDVNTLLEELRAFPEIIIAGQNFKAQPREKTPNDTRYPDQWGMEMIEAPEVWEVTTGGVTALGDTIVVAVVEGGDINHEDLNENLWINHNEVDGDGIDNDGNGYVDDYLGWNASDSSDVPVLRTHSTKVAGIVGAKGDNGQGITGVNWDVKLMFVHSGLQFDKIIESYEYIYQNRKLYNDSNGEKGAFVVTSNSSFGVGQSQISDNVLFPVWCEMYNMMGEVGVLSAGATDNAKYDVSAFGDIPSLCPSEHLIVVGNTTDADVRNSAWGIPHVDLTAPGDGTITTSSNDTYNTLGGTSAATPHVSGSVALLYSLPCETLAQLAIDDPKETSLLMKSFLMDSVDPIADQADETVSGGRLNLKKSMDLITAYCGTELGVLEINSLTPNPTNNILNVTYTPNLYGEYDTKIYNALGQLMYEGKIDVSQFTAAEFTLNASNYAPGTYFLTIQNQDDFTTMKFVVYQ